MSIRVTLFEDNHSLRISLYHLINGTDGFECVGAFENCTNLVKNIKNSQPNIVLMDIGMPGINGIEAVKILRENFPELKVIMQTIFEEDDKIFESILAGASGYILKNTSPARILESIKEAFEGGAPMSPTIATRVLKMVSIPHSLLKKDVFNLTAREREILALLVEGMSYQRIGDVCAISIDTVRGHIRNIYEKLHVHSKGEAVAKAIKKNIV